MQNSVLLKHRTAAWMLFLCLFGIAAALAAYQAIWPEASGKDVQKSKSLVVDASNCSQGYIMAHGGTGMKQLKLRVTQGKYKLTYDLGSAGEYEVFPLQLGDGAYTVELFENVSGKKYSAVGKVTLNVQLDDPYAPFLSPNQYVRYDENTEAVQMSYQLCEGLTDEKEIFETIRAYMRSNYAYDYDKGRQRSERNPAGYRRLLRKQKGHLSGFGGGGGLHAPRTGYSDAAGRGLGRQNIPRMDSVLLNGEEVLYDPTLELNAVESGSYTVERYY